MVASVLLFGVATMGFQAFTTDTARVLAVATHPTTVPRVALVDADGRSQSFADRQRITIVQFFYSRCTTVCATGGNAFQRLQAEVRRRGMHEQVRLLSVSFDPSWDTPPRLHAYRTLLGADSTLWSLATFTRAADLRPSLRAFGVRVIPDGQGGFAHNAAFHVVDTAGKLVAIEPIAEPLVDSRRGASAVSRDAFDAAIDAVLTSVERSPSRVALGGARAAR